MLLKKSILWAALRDVESDFKSVQVFFTHPVYRVYQQKTEQIWNRSQRHEAAQSIKFFINIQGVSKKSLQLENSR